MGDKSAAGTNLTENGNLVIFDKHNSTIWQSFDHPTDTLLLGQTLAVGARLTANVSSTNWRESQVHLTLAGNGLHAFVGSNPPQLYLNHTISKNIIANTSGYLKLTRGCLDMFLSSSKTAVPDKSIPLQNAGRSQYVRLEFDGHLRLYEFSDMIQDVLSDLSLIVPADCGYPTVWGYYGIFRNGKCSC